MASGPHWNGQRGTWSVQYWDQRWRRVVVMKRMPGWNPGDKKPRKPPPEAFRELERYTELEKQARRLTGTGVPGSIEEFLRDHQATHKNPKTRESVTKTYDQFLRWCRDEGKVGFSEVDDSACKKWIAFASKTLEVSTVKTRRAQLAAAWTKISGARIINPWKEARVTAKSRLKRRGSWSPEQFDKLLNVCRPWLKDILIMGTYTGLRINALMQLEKSHIDRSNVDVSGGFGYVRVPPELDKAGKGYAVPIGPVLHDLLFRIESEREGERLLVGQSGQPLVYGTSSAQAIVRACKRAHIAKPDSPNHHMRRTFGRWAHLGRLTGKPIPLYVVSRWLGHSTTNMTIKYLDIEEEDTTRFMLGETQDL